MNDLSKPICGAKTRSGGMCQSPPMPNGRCRMHGGSTPYGVASPHFKTGRYSKYLGRHRESYEQLIADESKLLDLREHIAALDAVAQRAAERAAALDTPDFRNDVRKLVDRMEVAFEEHDADELKQSFVELKALSRRGGAEDAALNTLGSALDRVARRVESAWKIKLQATGMSTQADVDLTQHAMLAILKEEVDDKKVLARVVTRFYQELLSEGPRNADPRGVPGANGGGSRSDIVADQEGRPMED